MEKAAVRFIREVKFQVALRKFKVSQFVYTLSSTVIYTGVSVSVVCACVQSVTLNCRVEVSGLYATSRAIFSYLFF